MKRVSLIVNHPDYIGRFALRLAFHPFWDKVQVKMIPHLHLNFLYENHGALTGNVRP